MAKNIILNNTQRQVLARVIDAPTPVVALQQTQNNANFTTATKQLIQLGLLSQEGGGLIATDIGQQAAVEENLFSEDGEITDAGRVALGGKPGKEDEVAESFYLIRNLLK